MVTPVCFFENNADIGQTYIDQTDVERRVLDGCIDPAWLSEQGHKAVTQDTIWAWGGSSAVRGNSSDISGNVCSPRIGPGTNCEWDTIVASNCCYVAAIKKNGTLWLWGLNSQGQLGDLSVINRSSPVQENSSSSAWTCVTIGDQHSIGLNSSGELYTWGRNCAGQLGSGCNEFELTFRTVPQREVSFSTWCSIGALSNSSYGIKTNGTLWGWGDNGDRALLGNGIAGTTPICAWSSPVQEASSSVDWCFVSSGATGAQSAIKSNGTLWSWGYGVQGQIGDNCNLNRCSPVREASSSSNWCTATAGNGTTIAIKEDGSLWGWGLNGTRFVVGTPPQTSLFSSPVQEISQSYSWCKASASFHMLGLKTDGTLWAWGGFVVSGELGAGAGVGATSSPVQEFHSLTDWAEVAAGTFYSLAIKR